MPLEDDEALELPRPSVETRATRIGGRSPWDDAAEDGLPLESAEGLSLDLADEREADSPRPIASEPGRRCCGWDGRSRRPYRTSWMTSRNSNPGLPRPPDGSLDPSWILAATAIVTLSIPMVFVLIRMVGGPGVGGRRERGYPRSRGRHVPSARHRELGAVRRTLDTESRRSRAARRTSTDAMHPAADDNPEAVLGRAGGQGTRTRRPGADLGQPQGIPSPPARLGPVPSARRHRGSRGGGASRRRGDRRPDRADAPFRPGSGTSAARSSWPTRARCPSTT